ncbi:MAG: radical SAM protein [Oscillospiraceae bacterium]
MSIVTTHKCQLNCPFCVDMHRKTSEEISIDNVTQALSFAKTKKIKDILLVGGEPTLHTHIVEIAQLIKSNGFRCILTTNYQRPDIVRQLDEIVDCFNISYYNQSELPKQRHFKSDLTLSVLLYKNRFNGKEDLDLFIDKYQKDMNIKFSTLTPCNKWAMSNQRVEWLDNLPFEWTGILFDEIIGHIYRNCIIKRYDRVVNPNAVQSYKCLVDGTIAKHW